MSQRLLTIHDAGSLAGGRALLAVAKDVGCTALVTGEAVPRATSGPAAGPAFFDAASATLFDAGESVAAFLSCSLVVSIPGEVVVDR